VIASSDSTDTGDSQVGDALLIERPAPSRSPGTEVTGPAAAPVDVPASAPATTAVAAPAVSAAPATTATATAPAATPSRPTQVLGVQITRSADGTEVTGLARTGASTSSLVLLAGLLLAVGAVLIKASQLRPAYR
jgi:hypothetical protein